MKELLSVTPWSRISARTIIATVTITLVSLLSGASLSAQQDSSGTVSQPTAAAPKPLIHIVPYMTPQERQKLLQRPTPYSAPAGALLTYYGGHVVGQTEIVIVYWGSGVFNPTKLDAGTGNTLTLKTFYTDILNTTFWDFLTEYNTTGVLFNGSTSNQTIARGSFYQEVTITPSTSATTIDDTQIQSEITNQINAAHLPAPTVDAAGNPNTIYMVYFPPGVTITDQGSSSCVAFCAYHGTVAQSVSLHEFFYGVIPDFQAGSGCDVGCGGATTLYDNMTSVSSHELVETVTDAEVGIAASIGPPLAWYDNTNNLGEIGDICNALQGTVATSRGTYTVQQEFSNQANDCVLSTVRSATSFSVSAPAGVQANVPFSVTVTAKNSANATAASYGGTVHFTSSDGAAILPADAKLTNGAGTFQATLVSGSPASLTATDNNQGAINGSANITVTSGSANATMTSPTIGAKLTGSSATFTWNPGSGATKFMLWVGNTYKGKDIFNQQFPVTTTSVLITNIPTNDNPLYVILWSYIGGVWQRQYYQYVEAGTPVASTMVTPTNYTPFSSTSQTFTWTLGQGVTKYVLCVGTTLKGSDIYKGTFPYGTTSVTVNNIPSNADAIYVILFSYINGVWQRNYYYYREPGTPVLATITTPTNGIKLAGSSQQFVWNPGHGATRYLLYLGTTYKGSNVYKNAFPAATTSVTVNNIPTTGQPLYVILFSFIDGVWQRQYYQYTEAGP